MTTSNIFLLAAQQKLRFDTPQGQVTTEQLFDLPLDGAANKATLENLAQALFKETQNDTGISFTKKRTVSNALANLKFEIVKYVIDSRLEKISEAEAAVAKRTQKQVLLEALSRKENEELSNLSIEELKKKLAAL